MFRGHPARQGLGNAMAEKTSAHGCNRAALQGKCESPMPVAKPFNKPRLLQEGREASLWPSQQKSQLRRQLQSNQTVRVHIRIR